MRWEVRSGKDIYQVDLFDSICSCSHWKFRLFDKPEAERRCKHIEAARERAFQAVIDKLKESR
jgi:hypothetical protein